MQLLWTAVAALVGGASAIASNEAIVGDVRVQALSPTLLRVEPRGPRGFEDRTTFVVANRSFPGVPIQEVHKVAQGTLVRTSHYSVLVKGPRVQPTCDVPWESTDALDGVRSPKFPKGSMAADHATCCALCTSDPGCSAWVFSPQEKFCWPLASFGSTAATAGRQLGCGPHGGCGAERVLFQVLSGAGEVLYDSAADQSRATNLLHWPAPLQSRSYALVDHPRFYAPAWGAGPIPAEAAVDPALLATHGYDFRNNVAGDSYVFLLGAGLAGWGASRGELLALTGPVPLLPDFAYGTWFTYWYSYTVAEAKRDIEHWESSKLPIDVWALDMNWRNTSYGQDHFYDHPNTTLFPNFTDWFAYLQTHRLRTYFNDHPYPVAGRGAGGLQTSPEETAFRWQGLSEWMARGLTFWWFDHNWAFSIPPPFVNCTTSDIDWQGLDNVAWGSHVYFTSVEQFDHRVRDRAGDKWYGGRPMTLTKFGKPDWRAGMDPQLHAESPAHHRYPVWWTGDGVNLQASVESMVDAGVHDLKPFVHSDCGGDYLGGAGDLLRWTAHCVFGSILRFHGADHRPWTYGPQIEGVIRSYLGMRYKMLPALIAAGHEATLTGFPLAARCDLFWPEHSPDSSTNQQYIFLGEILVAPIFDSSKNETSRNVWVPPGDWQDAWDGSVVTGPRTVVATQPYERQPMWHRRDGGLLVLADAPASRVEEQDWSALTLEAFPAEGAKTTQRSIFERGTGERTDLTLETDGNGTARLLIGSPAGVRGPDRGWTARFHLRPGQDPKCVTIDGQPVLAAGLRLLPAGSAAGFLPFGGAGTAPAPKAGLVVEVVVPAGPGPHRVEVQVSRGSPKLPADLRNLII